MQSKFNRGLIAAGMLAMVELFLPMLVFPAIIVSFAIEKKKRARQIVALE